MKSSRLFIALLTATALLHTAAASAAAIDMDDPRRVVGKENNVRVDAQLIQDTVSPGTPIGIVYQVQNQTSAPIALAANVASASFDSDTGTITFSIGAEIPDALFHRWFESQDTIFMNAVPVRFSPRAPGADASVGAMADASHRF